MTGDRVDRVQHVAGRLKYTDGPARRVAVVGRHELHAEREDPVQQCAPPTRQRTPVGEVGHQQQLAVGCAPTQRRGLHEDALQIARAQSSGAAGRAAGGIEEPLARLVQVQVLRHARLLADGRDCCPHARFTESRSGHPWSMSLTPITRRPAPSPRSSWSRMSQPQFWSDSRSCGFRASSALAGSDRATSPGSRPPAPGVARASFVTAGVLACDARAGNTTRAEVIMHV